MKDETLTKFKILPFKAVVCIVAFCELIVTKHHAPRMRFIKPIFCKVFS